MSKKRNFSDKITYSTKGLKIKKFSTMMIESKDRNDDGGLFGLLWDKGNRDAMKHHAGITKKYEDKEYTLSVDNPFIITINDFDDFYKFKFLFRKYKISYTEKEETKKAEITSN